MKFVLFLALSVCAHAQFFGGNAAKIRGKNVKGSLSCADGDALSWVAANSQFECAAPGAVSSSVGVKKAGTLVGTRAAINLIEGSNVTLTVSDDAGNNEVDVTVAATGSSGITVQVGGSPLPSQPVSTVNFAPGFGSLLAGSTAAGVSTVTITSESGPFTVANLPAAASNSGRVVIVSDCTSFTVLGAGGGSAACLVRSNGSSWVVQSGGSLTAFSATWFPFGPMQSSAAVAATALGSANRVHYFEFPVWHPVTLNKLRAYTNATGDAGDIAWGVYDSSCVLIAQTTTVNTTGSQQVRTWTWSSPPTLQPGKYFLAYGSNNANTQFYGTASGYYSDLADTGETTARSFFYDSSTSSTSAGTTTMPPNCTGTRNVISNSGSVPAVALR